MKANVKMKLVWKSGKWFVSDPYTPGQWVTVDSALVACTWIGPGAVEGFIVQSHGLAHEVFQVLNSKQLANLGIGVVSRPGRLHNGLRLMNLGSEGSITKFGS